MSSPRRIRPHQFEPIDSDGNPLTDAATYGAVFDGDRFLGWGEAGGGGGGGTVVFAETNKTMTIARNTSSGNTWNYASWTITHYAYMRIISFTCDILQADTYTFSIDGEDFVSVACGAASSANVFTLPTPKVITPGTHVLRLRPTAARQWYYNSGNAPNASGTYTTKVLWGPWREPQVTSGGITVPGTLTFDAEGVLT